ncbi:MAG: hypothetical protein IT558_03405 [Alphaproteobacteria bacterium]|nr:hypothetical protein [Alphaproteobacteria bacterium]
MAGDQKYPIHEVWPRMDFDGETYHQLGHDVFAIAAACHLNVEQHFEVSVDTGFRTFKISGPQQDWENAVQQLSQLKTQSGEPAIELIQ